MPMSEASGFRALSSSPLTQVPVSLEELAGLVRTAANLEALFSSRSFSCASSTSDSSTSDSC